MKRITIKDIAERSGYTVVTVSRALNNNEMVNARTREKIYEIAKEMGYAGIQLPASESLPTVGVVVPDINNPYFPLLIKGIQEQLAVEGLSTVICNSNSSPQTELECLKTLVAANVMGIIMDPISDYSYKKLRYISSQIPVIFTSNVPKGSSLNYITIDNYAAGELATNYLISLGHKRIAYIGGNEETNTFRSRYSGYCDVIKRHFSSVNRHLTIKAFPSREGGFQAANRIMTTNESPTAFFAANDLLAIGVLEYMHRHGFRVPEDISVIGIDNIEMSSMPGIDLTTIEEPRYQLGKQAAQALLSLLDQHETATLNQTVPFQKMIQPQLIIRSTCGKALAYASG